MNFKVLYRVSILPITEVMTWVASGQESQIISGHSVETNNLRLQTFLHKGLQCAACGLAGQYFALEKMSTGKYALHLYAKVGDEEILFTKDHIIPSSRQGSDELSNFQTLCYPCNIKKGDYHPEQDLSTKRRSKDYGKQYEYQKRRAGKLIQKIDNKLREARIDGNDKQRGRLMRHRNKARKLIDKIRRKKPRQNPDNLESIKAELEGFSAANKLPSLADRARRGLDPIGILAVDPTASLVRELCYKLGAQWSDVLEMSIRIQLGGPWDYAKQLKGASTPAAQVWIMMNAANTLGKAREMDMTPSEFLTDLERIKDNLKKAIEDPNRFLNLAQEYVIETAKQSFRMEAGVPISELDNGFIHMAVSGYEAGIIQDADGMLFVGAKRIDEKALESWGLRVEMRADRGRQVKFYVSDDGNAVFKLLYPGFGIVISRSFELAKAIVLASIGKYTVPPPEALGHTLYKPTSAAEKSQSMLDAKKGQDPMDYLRRDYTGDLTYAKSLWGPEAVELTLENWFGHSEHPSEEFYLRMADVKSRVIFLDKVENLKEKGQTEINLEEIKTKTREKVWQKMEELQYMMGVMGDSLQTLPANVDTVLDMAGGTGDLGLTIGFHLQLLGHPIRDVQIIDPFSVSHGLAHFMELILSHIPNGEALARITRHTNQELQEANITQNGIVVGKHACGDLTDTIIEKWVDSSSPMLCVMTCCQDKAKNQPARYNIPQDMWYKLCKVSSKTNSSKTADKAEGLDAMTRLDKARVHYLNRYGFTAQLHQTTMFPKGDVIIAKRLASNPSNLERRRDEYWKIRDRCMEHDIVWSEPVFDNLVRDKLKIKKWEPTPSNWVEAAKNVELDLMRREYKRIRARSLAGTPKRFDNAVQNYLSQKEWTPRYPINWIMGARAVAFTCEKCGGSGTYPARPVKELGRPLHVGKCFRCDGKGRQNDADRTRNIAYDKYHEDVMAAKGRISERNKLERLLAGERKGSPEYNDILADIAELDRKDADYNDKINRDILSQKYEALQKPYEEYLEIRRQWKKKREKRLGRPNDEKKPR